MNSLITYQPHSTWKKFLSVFQKELHRKFNLRWYLSGWTTTTTTELRLGNRKCNWIIVVICSTLKTTCTRLTRAEFVSNVLGTQSLIVFSTTFCSTFSRFIYCPKYPEQRISYSISYLCFLSTKVLSKTTSYPFCPGTSINIVLSYCHYFLTSQWALFSYWKKYYSFTITYYILYYQLPCWIKLLVEFWKKKKDYSIISSFLKYIVWVHENTLSAV